MKLWSESWASGERIPARYAAGRPGAAGPAFSENVNPHLAWGEVPVGTRSFALICHDFDVPSRREDLDRPDRELPQELPRIDFFHWVLVDLPATLEAIAEGEFSDGFVPHGKPGPQALYGARQGLNDYTGFMAGHPDLAGRYYGYDGPFPPANDSLIHHYVFTLYALAESRVAVEGDFTGPQVRAAIYADVLAEATWSGTYTLNPRLAG